MFGEAAMGRKEKKREEINGLIRGFLLVAYSGLHLEIDPRGAK